MNHDEIRDLIHAYADGELDLIRAREIEQHLSGCEECDRAIDQIRKLHVAITGNNPAFQASARVRRNIHAALRRESKEEMKFSFWPALATAAACLVIALGIALFTTTQSSNSNRIADEVVANHVRSLLATHLVDVTSSDQHTVKPWFDGKIDFAPDVHDFSMSGFPLVGGRLDYLNGNTVVALVYQRNKHPINVFIAPAKGSEERGPTATTRRGYNLLSWTHAGMNYWAISDLNQTELHQFASLLER